MFVDHRDNIWVGTNKGFNKIVINGSGSFEISSFTKAHGLPSNEVRAINHDKNRNILLIGTDKGLFLYDCKEKLKTNIHIDRPNIQSLKVNNRQIKLDSIIRLNYNENNLSLELLTKNFKMNGKIPYQFKMNNGSWVDLGVNRNITLFQLSPNSYTIEYRSQNEDKIWSQAGIIKIIISPPWWRTKWFYSLIALAFVMISYLFFKRRENKITEKNKIKEEINKLERAALQAQMNPHFIFNSLNSIQNYIVNSDRISASEYLSKFAFLIRLNLQYSDKTKISIQEELKILDLYLQLEKLRFKDKFIYKIDSSGLKDTIDNIFIPPMLIQPIIENSIKHGVSRLEGGGLIDIVFENISVDIIQVSIKDNGPGLNRQKSSIDHLSMGTSITSKRLSYILKDAGDGFSINNILDNSGRVVGTLAILKIRKEV
ncbi:MAG: hypothetical protein RLZZ546_2062 [Bacteroidota bacterium]|jgi:hypothetical protein